MSVCPLLVMLILITSLNQCVVVILKFFNGCKREIFKLATFLTPRMVLQEKFSLLPHLFFIYFILFFGGVGSSLLHEGFLQLRRAGSTLHRGARTSHCGGFSCCRAQGSRLAGFSSCGSRALERMLSSCDLQALGHRLSSCGARVQLLRGMWDLPGPGLEPVSPASAGGFLTTEPLGKSIAPFILFLKIYIADVYLKVLLKTDLFSFYSRSCSAAFEGRYLQQLLLKLVEEWRSRQSVSCSGLSVCVHFQIQLS